MPPSVVRGTVVDVDPEVWDDVMAVNLKGMMLASKHAIPKMIEAGGGSIVNIASIDGAASEYLAQHPLRCVERRRGFLDA